MDNEDDHSDVDDNNSYSKKIFASMMIGNFIKIIKLYLGE